MAIKQLDWLRGVLYMPYCILDSQYFTHANLVLVKMNLFSHTQSIKQNSNVIKICHLVMILLIINIQTLKKIQYSGMKLIENSSQKRIEQR